LSHWFYFFLQNIINLSENADDSNSNDVYTTSVEELKNDESQNFEAESENQSVGHDPVLVSSNIIEQCLEVAEIRETENDFIMPHD